MSNKENHQGRNGFDNTKGSSRLMEDRESNEHKVEHATTHSISHYVLPLMLYWIYFVSRQLMEEKRVPWALVNGIEAEKLFRSFHGGTEEPAISQHLQISSVSSACKRLIQKYCCPFYQDLTEKVREAHQRHLLKCSHFARFMQWQIIATAMHLSCCKHSLDAPFHKGLKF